MADGGGQNIRAIVPDSHQDPGWLDRRVSTVDRLRNAWQPVKPGIDAAVSILARSHQVAAGRDQTDRLL
jgi:hypothetical protein